MAQQALKGLMIAILATDGFEQFGLLGPRRGHIAPGFESSQSLAGIAACGSGA